MLLFARSFRSVPALCAAALLSVPVCGQFTDPTVLNKSDVFGGDGYRPGERTMDVVDLDQDGLDDILMLGYQGPIWYKGTPTGFEAARQAGARDESCVREIKAGDLDGDGLPDILTIDALGDAAVWYKNLGAGAFSSVATSVTTYGILNCAYQADLEDMDADGDLDVVIAYYFGFGMRWFPNNGAGLFGAAVDIFSTGNAKNGIHDFVVGDIDGDGDNDIVSANVNVVYDGLFVTERAQNGFFAPVDILPAGMLAGGLALGDLDNDGDLDIAFSSSAPERIQIMLNDGSGGFTLSALSMPGYYEGDLELGDVDGDGHLDLLSAPWESTNSPTIVNRNLGGPTLAFEPVAGISHTERAHLKVWNSPSGTRIISREAAPEAGAYVKIHQFVSAENAWASDYISSKVPMDDLLAVDLSGDGLLDIVGCDNIGSAVTLYTQGPTTLGFTPRVLFVGPGRPVVLRSADFDADGDQDIVSWASIPGPTGNTGLFFVRNNGANGFTHDTLLAFVPPSILSGLHVSDLDGDGDLDILLSLYNYDQLRYLVNDGTGAFTPVWSPNLFVNVRGINLYDFNSDGLVDIVFNTINHALRWMRNDGALAFTLMPYSATGPLGIEPADMDNDGDEDLYTMTSGNLTWWPRTGPTTFGPAIANPLPISLGTLSDLDGDGFLDYVRVITSTATWYQGLGGGAFATTPQTIYTGHIDENGLFADLDLDGDKEILFRVYIGTRQQPHLLLLENTADISTPVREQKRTAFSAVPNPFTDHTVLRSGGALTPQHVVQLCDVQGRALRTLKSNNEGQVLIDRGSLSAGLYLVRVLSATGAVQETLRLVAE